VFDDVECECIIISDQVCKKISTVQTPEGCFGEFLLPDVQWPKLSSLLVFDRIQDPGNMGTLLRTALAFGIRNVVCILPCCDIWNPKVLRAAKGAQFDMTIVSCSWEQLLQHKTDQVILVADAKGTPIQRVPKEWWLVLGNEAHGSSIPLETTKEYVSIPLIGPVESLNVAQAGAILLHELTRA
jgi:TrmH family RNA methyltransferase